MSSKAFNSARKAHPICVLTTRARVSSQRFADLRLEIAELLVNSALRQDNLFA
jgi:hypothetical protein